MPLHDLRHEAAHGLRRLILHLPCGVGISTEGEARVVMAQHTGDRLDVHPVLQGQCSEGMSQVCQCQARTNKFLKILWMGQFSGVLSQLTPNRDKQLVEEFQRNL